jgi:hypothetical protein
MVINAPTTTKTTTNLQTQTSKYVISFDYAARQNFALHTSKGLIFWNNVQVGEITPTDYAIRTFTVTVNAAQGNNFITFEGAGGSDGVGLGVQNVKLVKVGGSVNEVVNGMFGTPSVGNKNEVTANIQGWIGAEIEIGPGNSYNSAWSGQVLELDGTHNDSVTQNFASLQ